MNRKQYTYSKYENKRCKLSEAGKAMLKRKDKADRLGTAIRETDRYYLVQWDGARSQRSYAKEYIEIIPDKQKENPTSSATSNTVYTGNTMSISDNEQLLA